MKAENTHVIRNVIIIFCAVMFIASLALVFGLRGNRQLEIAKKEVAETVKVDLETYLSNLTDDYKTEVIRELDKEDVINEITYLSSEQIDAIVKEITVLVKERLMEEAVNPTFTEQELVKIEKEIAEKVEKSLGAGAGSMTKSEKDALITSITTITETTVLNELRQEFYELEENIQILTEKVESNVNSLKESLEKQGDSILVLQDRIKELEDLISSLQNGTSTDFKDMSAELNQLREDHSRLYSAYLASQLVALNTSDIVTNLIAEPTNSDGVVSAKAGHVMKTDISNLQNDIMNLNSYLDSTFTGIDSEFDRLERMTEKKLGDLSSDSSAALEDARKALQDAIDGNATDIDQLNEALEQAQKALSDNLSDLDSKTADALKEAEKKLSDTISQVKDDLESRPVVTYEFTGENENTTCVVTVPAEQ